MCCANGDLTTYLIDLRRLPVFSLFSNDFELQPDLLETTERTVRSRLSDDNGLKTGGTVARRRSSSLDSQLDSVSASLLSHSRLLDPQTVLSLRMYLGMYSASNFRLCFSTHRDGWSLDTLYALTARRFPCVLLVRSLETRALVGAFLPVPVSPPSPRVRGDGRTFIFRLDGSSAKCYGWKHRERANDAPDGPSDMDLAADLAHQQFAVCSSAFIIIGGSAKHGTNALRIDSDLKTCYCGPSDTFDNDPLVPEELSQPFTVGKNSDVSCFATDCNDCRERGSVLWYIAKFLIVLTKYSVWNISIFLIYIPRLTVHHGPSIQLPRYTGRKLHGDWKYQFKMT